MQTDRQIVKSERVVLLTASCIRSLVRLSFSYEMSMRDAVELAHAHDLRSAIGTVRAKLELHRGKPELAVTEAKLTRNLVSTEELRRTLEVRREAVATEKNTEDGARDREALVERLRVIRRESELWARQYSAFMRRLSSVYSEGRKQIAALRLPPGNSTNAQLELERIILEAMRRAAEIPVSDVGVRR